MRAHLPVAVTRAIVLAGAVAAAVALAGCGSGPAAPVVSATAWPEADALFHADPRWIGGDGAYSADLGGGRVLWLFGDSFVATDASNTRAHSTMVRNSVAIQTGYDPSAATIQFHWRTGSDGKPASFFAESGAHWFWPGQAIKLPDALLVLLTEVGPTTGGLGFETIRWAAVRIDNPDDDPAAWHAQSIAVAPNDWKLVPATGLSFDGADLTAYAFREPSHDIHLVRFFAADLTAPAWFDEGRFVPQPALAHVPSPVMRGVATELSVTSRGGGFVAVDNDGFGHTTVDVRTAPAREGPWSQPAHAYRPPENDRAAVFTYAGKGHPELLGADLVATYASNHMDFAMLVADTSLYFPRFVRLRFE
ncbi:MAG: hypothetical protein JWN44_3822 [Myxococcales bacterium]|nr:hypothetical protein [Myxococcales bacterium]